MKDPAYLLLGAGLCFGAVFAVMTPAMKTPPPPPPLEAPVPLQDSTPTADAGAIAMRLVPGKLPPPGPNQIQEPGKCPWPAKFINGGCWMSSGDVLPPCESPDKSKKLWAHENKCWTPYAEAKPTPQSGEPKPRGVAEP